MDINPAPQFQFLGQPSHNQFTCFLRLPLEIRQEIWQYVLASKEASVITLTRADTSRLEDEGNRCFLVTTHLVKASYKICPLAHVCHESRAICLSRYQLCFEGPLEHPILFDSKTDLLLMSDLRALSSFLGLPWDSFSRGQTDCANMVRYLAICGDWRRFQDLLMPRLYHFHNLEHIILEAPNELFMSHDPLEVREQVREPFMLLFDESSLVPLSDHMNLPIITGLRDHQAALAREESEEFKVPKVDVLPRRMFDGTGTGE